MTGAAAVAAVLLAATFAWAAGLKLADRSAVVATFAELRLRRPDVLAVAVPSIELAVALALVTVPRVGAAGALVLLVAFTVVLGRVIAGGAAVSCACFGASSSAPVGVVDLVRNTALAAVAVAIVAVSPPGGRGMGAAVGWVHVLAVPVAWAVAATTVGAARRRISPPSPPSRTPAG